MTDRSTDHEGRPPKTQTIRTPFCRKLVYRGELHDGLYHGFGELFRGNYTFKGVWRNGVPLHGFLGSRFGAVTIMNDEPVIHGPGYILDGYRVVAACDFINGVPVRGKLYEPCEKNGAVTVTCGDRVYQFLIGKLVYQGELSVEVKPCGKGSLRVGRMIYHGYFNDTEFDGHYTVYDYHHEGASDLTSTTIHEYSHTCIYQDGKITREMYYDGKTLVREHVYTDGEQEIITYHENGMLASRKYRGSNLKIHEEYRENGILKKKTKTGRNRKVNIFYDEKGVCAKTERYYKGTKIGQMSSGIFTGEYREDGSYRGVWKGPNNTFTGIRDGMRYTGILTNGTRQRSVTIYGNCMTFSKGGHTTIDLMTMDAEFD